MQKDTIAFDPKRKRFYSTHSKKILRGLHGVLERQFYPVGSSYENLKKRPAYKTKSGKRLPGVKGRKPIRTARRAKNLGSRVDKHMQKLVEAAKGDPLVLRSWVDKTPTLGTFLKKNMPKAPIKKIEPEAMGAIRILLDQDWIPIACQVPIGSVGHGIAHSADAMCKHAKQEGRLAIVEVKTGYDQTWQAHTGQYLNAPLGELRDTMENKAHLQVACGALLYKASEGRLPEPFVLRVSTQAITLAPLLPVMQKSLNAIGRQLVATK